MNRYDIINKFIETRNFNTYLEIGVDGGDCFSRIQAKDKVGVDTNPNSAATVINTSDNYFNSTDKMFDIIFIDGLHLCEQVYKDIENSLKHLNSNGVIVLHDLLPSSEYLQYRRPHGAWNGDCWKAFAKYRSVSNYFCYTINTDFGCGVIDTSKQSTGEKFQIDKDMSLLTWNDFVENRDKWMNVVDDIIL